MTNEIQILNSLGEILKMYKAPDIKVQFEGVDWVGVVLIDAQLAGANFKNANLYWGMFNGSCLVGANFEGANLQGANLSETSCIGANFRGANLGRDNLGGSTRLQSADLSNSILHAAIMDGAEYDDSTKFPKGFHPRSHGMIETEIL